MMINVMVLGAFQTNCYVLRKDAAAADCVIIDPGLEAQPLIDFLDKNNLIPSTVILTHGHADHIAGLIPLRKRFGDFKIAIHPADADMLSDPMKNLSVMHGQAVQTDTADQLIENEGHIILSGIAFEIFHTPGHSAGGICLYIKDEGVVFTGDALFAGSVGRSDFSGGNHEQLVEGIAKKLFKLPEETIVYPGHGQQTTIGQEKKYNPYFM